MVNHEWAQITTHYCNSKKREELVLKNNFAIIHFMKGINSYRRVKWVIRRKMKILKFTANTYLDELIQRHPECNFHDPSQDIKGSALHILDSRLKLKRQFGQWICRLGDCPI